MFGLFNKKLTPSVTKEDKQWIEDNIAWLIEVFGMAHLKEPFILPDPKLFPYHNLQDEEQFQKLFTQLCDFWEVDVNEIQVKFFDDIKSKEWNNWAPLGEVREATGLFEQSYQAEEKKYSIQIAKSNLSNLELLISVIAHELSHVKLIGGQYIRNNEDDLESFSDLACIYWGFGIFMANTCQIQDVSWIGRVGYLPNEIISYCNALLCYIGKVDYQNYEGYFNSNTKSLFRQDSEFLIKTKDTDLSPPRVEEINSKYTLAQSIEESFEKKDFDQAIKDNWQLLEINQNNPSAYNSIGYAYLMQKEYQKAIDAFTSAIDQEPYFDYAYNNRGYCKLQLGQMEKAFSDLMSAFEMNRDNPYAWRNLGAYYLANKAYDKAIKHLEQALNMEAETEMIHLYLSEVYKQLGNSEKSETHKTKSIEREEYNYSVLLDS